MQSNEKEIECANFPKEIFVKVHIPYERKLHNAIKQECLRQNDIARAVGGELNINFRTKKKGDEILIYRLK